MTLISESYSEWSKQYDTDVNRTRDLDRQLVRKKLAKRSCTHVLELGCGTGKNTAFYAQIGKRVTAVDFSDGMLEIARAKVDSPHVVFLKADLTQNWQELVEPADLICCNLVLEHIENLPEFFSRAAKATQSGGLLFLSELHPSRQYEGKQAHFFDGRGQRRDVDGFIHHIADYIGPALSNGFTLTACDEWWHQDDADRPPRIISFEFLKR